MRRILALSAFGALGAALLAALGIWQVQRLAWKQGVLADISARIAAPPAALPARPDRDAHRYMPVALSGAFGDAALRVLVSRKGSGAGYRLVSPFDAAGRRVLVDRGYIRTDAALPAPPAGAAEVAGNLHWPDDRTAATPRNDPAGNLWFARDVTEMARALDAEPILVVARSVAPAEPGLSPIPVGVEGIPNNHLQYAVTWFSLAAIWIAMTAWFVLRSRRGGAP